MSKIMWEDDDDSSVNCLYSEGRWVWDEQTEGLAYIRDDVPENYDTSLHDVLKAPASVIVFRNYVDIVDQIRFRHRYQRKTKIGEEDVVKVQDIKDIVLFTAPTYIMTPMLINILHQRTTERFIRALILYCQYYLQVEEKMTSRIAEGATKIRTKLCNVIENEYTEDLADLRLIVAVEYSRMLTGCNDVKKFHHMGAHKTSRSLGDKDLRFYETLIRICLQIVWISLGRRAFSKLEQEIQRLLKSDHFNSTARVKGPMTAEQRGARAVLHGHCRPRQRKHISRSPLMEEVFGLRPFDYRLAALGVVVNQKTSARLQFLASAISAPEEILSSEEVHVGILGLPRDKFDIMLVPLPPNTTAMKYHSVSSVATKSVTSHKSLCSKKSEFENLNPKLFPDIVLPPKEEADEYLEPSFPEERCEVHPCCETQRKLWMKKYKKNLKQK